MSDAYVDRYQLREKERLQDQAGTLGRPTALRHVVPAWKRGPRRGCGVGAQTVTLAQRSPDARFTSVDVSADSVAEAKRSPTATTDDVEWLAETSPDVVSLQELKTDDSKFPAAAILRGTCYDLRLRGTFAPALRASERPIAIACLRLVTFFPDFPLRSVPFFRSSIAFFTFD